jgi:type IV fimbrial biogenesis protein FimT
MHRRQKVSGFTIMELMIVVAIVGVLAAFAMPNFRDLVARMRLKTGTSELHSSLLLARSEAVKRNAAVAVVPVDASNWAMGWSVRVGAVILSRQDSQPAVTFAPRSAAYAAKTVTNITFQGTGREASADGVAFILTATSLPGIGARCVILDPSGRPTVRIDGNGNPADGCN